MKRQVTQKELDALTEQLQNYELTKSDAAQTFLEIIGKSNHEVYITDILAYLLKPHSNNGCNVAVSLFVDMLGLNIDVFTDEILITTNKYVDGDYIDLFLEVKNKFVVVVENKIWSLEHGKYGDQTEQYYKYCERVYKNITRKYVLLKPTNNRMIPYCNQLHGNIYQIISYSELINKVFSQLDFINCNQNYQRILADFIEHCNRRFGMSEELFDLETDLYLKNIETIQYLQYKYDEKLSYIKNCVADKLKDKNYELDRADAKKTYRFYKNILSWWYPNCYYLYFEVKYNDNNLNDVECQLTIANYCEKKGNQELSAKFEKIVTNLEKQYGSATVVDGDWYVFEKERIVLYPNDTVNDYVNRIVDKLFKVFSDCRKYEPNNRKRFE